MPFTLEAPPSKSVIRRPHSRHDTHRSARFFSRICSSSLDSVTTGHAFGTWPASVRSAHVLTLYAKGPSHWMLSYSTPSHGVLHTKSASVASERKTSSNVNGPRSDACRAEIARGVLDVSATGQNGVRTSSSTSRHTPPERKLQPASFCKGLAHA